MGLPELIRLFYADSFLIFGVSIKFGHNRRQGYGEELESFMINRFLEEGRVPYAHIIVDNEKSMNLQKKLGYEVADKKIYWLFEK